jgi:hypothetical protein
MMLRAKHNNQTLVVPELAVQALLCKMVTTRTDFPSVPALGLAAYLAWASTEPCQKQVIGHISPPSAIRCAEII